MAAKMLWHRINDFCNLSMQQAAVLNARKGGVRLRPLSKVHTSRAREMRQWETCAHDAICGACARLFASEHSFHSNARARLLLCSRLRARRSLYTSDLAHVQVVPRKQRTALILLQRNKSLRTSEANEWKRRIDICTYK